MMSHQNDRSYIRSRKGYYKTLFWISLWSITIIAFFSGMYLATTFFTDDFVKPVLREVDIAGLRRLYVQDALDALQESITEDNDTIATIWLEKVNDQC